MVPLAQLFNPIVRMPRTAMRLIALALVLATAAIDCAAQSVPIIQPGAPNTPSRTINVEQSVQLSRTPINSTDVKFMQDMIVHHAQAVEMVELLKTRSTRPDLAQLAERIALSQSFEISLMSDWLKRRDATIPPPHSHHHSGSGPAMHGMLSPQQMEELAAAQGPAFDRLFLLGMIQHHAGALDMVKALAAIPGANEDIELSEFTSDIVSSQSAEISRMRGML